MKAVRHALLIFATLIAVFPHAARACQLDIDGPALVILETASEISLGPAVKAGGPVVLEASASHLVLAVRAAGPVNFDGPTDCDAQASVTRAKLHHRVSGGAVVTSFHALPTKEEDHEFDPDPKNAGRALVTLIELGPAALTKEEDHEFDPDPKSWTEDWDAVSAVVRRLGAGWYFVVRGGVVTREVLVED